MENHQLKRNFFALGIAILALSSCSSGKVESENPVELILEISDSLQIDFLEK